MAALSLLSARAAIVFGRLAALCLVPLAGACAHLAPTAASGAGGELIDRMTAAAGAIAGEPIGAAAPRPKAEIKITYELRTFAADVALPALPAAACAPERTAAAAAE